MRSVIEGSGGSTGTDAGEAAIDGLGHGQGLVGRRTTLGLLGGAIHDSIDVEIHLDISVLGVIRSRATGPVAGSGSIRRGRGRDGHGQVVHRVVRERGRGCRGCHGLGGGMHHIGLAGTGLWFGDGVSVTMSAIDRLGGARRLGGSTLGEGAFTFITPHGAQRAVGWLKGRLLCAGVSYGTLASTKSPEQGRADLPRQLVRQASGSE